MITKPQKLLLLGLLLLTATLLPQHARASSVAPVGRKWYVGGSGSDTASGASPSTAFRTIQKAADATGPGDTVFVMDGTYTSDNYLVVAIAHPGARDAWITYQAYPGSKPLLKGNAHNWSVVRFLQTAAYISLSGFTIVGNDDHVTLSQAQAAANDPVHHPEVNGNCIDIDGSNGIVHPHHIHILHNIAASCTGAGIGTNQADYITISGNTVYNNSWYTAFGTSGISNLSNFDSDPPDTTTRYKMVITGNKVYGNREYIPWHDYKPPTITDGEGIIIDSNRNSDYPNGHVNTPPYTGRTLVANNVIYGNGSAAIEVFQSAHVDIVNNSTYGNVLTEVETGRGELNINEASDVEALNNIFQSLPTQNPVVIATRCKEPCVLDYNVYFGGDNKLTGTKQGEHDIVADPLYLRPAAGDSPESTNLKLKPASPAIHSGTSAFAPAQDAEERPRPSTNGVDRGAYQQ